MLFERRRSYAAAVARILIVGGGCRGRQLAGELISDGHALRITTRAEAGRDAIEAIGAECLVGTPNRLATLRGALENVTIACWVLATADGPPDTLAALHDSRLEFFLTQAIDTTVRGLVYETGAPGGLAAAGEASVRELTARNAIPVEFLTAGPGDVGAWVAQARGAIASLLTRA
jgi:hypothetical protein